MLRRDWSSDVCSSDLDVGHHDPSPSDAWLSAADVGIDADSIVAHR
jgi:hypothetical protein